MCGATSWRYSGGIRVMTTAARQLFSTTGVLGKGPRLRHGILFRVRRRERWARPNTDYESTCWPAPYERCGVIGAVGLCMTLQRLTQPMTLSSVPFYSV